MLQIQTIKKDFPILNTKIQGSDVIYLDNAATSQKPQFVLDKITEFYSTSYANIHRGAYTLSETATQMYEDARKKIANFIGATVPEEVIFTYGTTDSINFISSTFADSILKPGDKILITDAEHHSNLVPWQQLAQKKEVTLEFLSISGEGFIDLNELKSKLANGVKILSLFHSSNVLGSVLDIKGICKIAHEFGAYVVVDGAQAVPHMPIDVTSMDCDFYAFSGHKMLGPTGIGVLYIKRDHLKNVSPFRFGGGMIYEVTTESSSWADVPERFEAGTPDIAGAIGLGYAVEYLSSIGMDEIYEHEKTLSKYALEKLNEVSGLKIIGNNGVKNRSGVVSFTINSLHAHDIASVLNTSGICVRSGHHCTMPLHKKFNVPATVRASFYLYNDENDVDTLCTGLQKAIKILG